MSTALRKQIPEFLELQIQYELEVKQFEIGEAKKLAKAIIDIIIDLSTKEVASFEDLKQKIKTRISNDPDELNVENLNNLISGILENYREYLPFPRNGASRTA